MPKFNVPFKRESLDIYQVDAKSRMEAAMLAERARNAGVPPTHTHETKFELGKIEQAVPEPEGVGDDA